MRPLQSSVAFLTLSLMAAAGPAEAGWDNVFQVTCWHRQGSNYGPAYSYYTPAYSYYSPAPVYSSYSSPGCCDPCPQPQCTTKYVQRCYYQPVTTYQTQSYYEPITTYQTKTYYEPVTSYRYSCYYDPCTCRYQQVATPVVSYQARQQCCPVQSWVQRCAQVPVTSYQKSFYWEPQTTCCSTPCAQPCCGSGQAVPQAGCGSSPAVPQIEQKQTGPPPQVDGKSSSDQYYRQYEPGNTQSQFRQMTPNGQPTVPSNSAPAPQGPGLKLERIAMGGNGVAGQVVNDARAPRSGVQVTFVPAKRQGADKTVTSDGAGNFQVDLSMGTWLVYIRTADGQQVFHSRMEVEAQQKTPMVLVSR